MKKKIFCLIGVLVLGAIYIAISSINSNSKTSTTIPSENKSEELETESKSNDQNTNINSNNNTGAQKHFNYTMDSSKYNEFLTRLNTIEKNDSETNKKADTTYDITMYSNEFNKQYDTLLNDIYNYLKGVMPENEFKKLQDDEIEWINEKETAIKKNVQEHQGGSMNAYTASLTSLDYTHKRICEVLEEVK